MKLVFVYWGYENAGSMLDLRGYARAAKAMGHEMTVYGPPNPKFALELFPGPRRRRRGRLRLRVDDGAAIRRPVGLGAAGRRGAARSAASSSTATAPTTIPSSSHGDYNHRTEDRSRDWTRRLRQPVRQDLPADVAPAAAERAAVPVPHLRSDLGERRFDFPAKEFGMIYVGHTKFRWRGMSQVLRGDRAGARAGRPRRPRGRGLGQSARNGRSGWTSGPTTTSTGTT